MNIPDCYDAVRQAECREAELDRREARRKRCGCCGRVMEPGDRLWTVSGREGTISLCRSCKEDLDEGVSLAQEVPPYDL